MRQSVEFARHQKFIQFTEQLTDLQTMLSKKSNQYPVEGSIYQIDISHPDHPQHHIMSWWNLTLTEAEREQFERIKNASDRNKYGFKFSITQ